MQKRYIAGSGILLAVCIGFIMAILFPQPVAFPSEEICDFKDNDLDGEIDEGFTTTCRIDADCGESGFFGEPYCKNEDIYQAWYQSDCIGEPDTCASKCQSRQTEKLLKNCKQGCRAGTCISNN
jgi:hypothetical protein